MARTRNTAAKEKDGKVETINAGVLEQPKASKPAKSSPRKRKAATNKEENQETVKLVETKKTTRVRAKKFEEPQVKMDEEADEIPPKRGRKTAKGKTSTGKQNNSLERVIVDHDAYFSPDESMEREIATSNKNVKGRESNYHSADENLSDSEASSAASNTTFTFETDAQENNVNPENEKAKRLKARGKKEKQTVTPTSSPAGSTASGATFTFVEDNKENLNARKTKIGAAPKAKSVQIKLGSDGPMTPGERYREAHEKIDAAGENIGERRERIAKHREAYAKETKGTIFERLATPKAVLVRKNRRPPTNHPGYDFGDGKQMAAFNFKPQAIKAKDAQKAAASTALAKTVKTRPVAAQKVGVKELTRQSKIPLAVRREAKKVEQAVVRQEVHFINRQIITPKLTKPTNNATINRLATPKSEFRTGEATRLAREGRIFKRAIHAHVPFVDTSNLNDKQYRQAVELGLISKQDGQMVFHDDNYQELLENAPNKRELQLLHDIHMKIRIKN